MNKHYKFLYDGRIEDIKFLVEQQYAFLWMLRRNPGHIGFKNTLDNIGKAIKDEMVSYKLDYWHELKLEDIW